MSDLLRYRCHKVVQAAKVAGVRRSETVGTMQVLVAPSGAGELEEVSVPDSYMQKHDPQPGGYYALHEDGYQSWSPADAFESGYTLIEE